MVETVNIKQIKLQMILKKNFRKYMLLSKSKQSREKANTSFVQYLVSLTEHLCLTQYSMLWLNMTYSFVLPVIFAKH